MNEVRITVKSEKTVSERNRKTGDEYRKQQVALDIGGDYPLPFFITVDQPYPPGTYTLTPGSFRVNQFNSLELNPYALELVPIK